MANKLINNGDLSREEEKCPGRNRLCWRVPVFFMQQRAIKFVGMRLKNREADSLAWKMQKGLLTKTPSK